MKIRKMRVLRGPNAWAGCSVLECEFDSAGTVAAAVEQAERFAAGAKKLQEIAGMPVSFTAVRGGDCVCVAVEFVDAALAQEAAAISLRLLTAGGEFAPTDDDVRRLKACEYAQRMSPSVATTVSGAKKLGIPVARLSAEYNGYLLLGQGSKQHRVRWSEPDAVSGVARIAATDKYLTNQLLASIGIPVPRGRLIEKVEEAWPAAQAVGFPVVVKPYNCDLQTGVSLDLKTQERVEAAFHGAAEHSSWVLVEHFAPGVEHRVIVVGERVVAVTRIDPPKVVGDGVSTIAQLVEIVNREPRRSGDDRSDAPLSKLTIDDIALGVIAAQGYTLDSVPPRGSVTLVRRDPPYFKNGGTLTDLTDVIHPRTIEQSVAAANMMQIPVAGLDVVAGDISKPLEEQEGVIVEINANPGLWLHLAPWADSPRPVGQEMVAWMFRDHDGRIPIFAVVGARSGAVAKHLVEMLTAAGRRVGVAGRTEMSIAGRRWPMPSGTPQEIAHILLRDPTVDVAVFEVNADSLLEHGFATDRCDVAIVVGPQPAAMVRALSHALGANGRVVTTRDGIAGQLAIDSARVVVVDDGDSHDLRLAKAAL